MPESFIIPNIQDDNYIFHTTPADVQRSLDKIKKIIQPVYITYLKSLSPHCNAYGQALIACLVNNQDDSKTQAWVKQCVDNEIYDEIPVMSFKDPVSHAATKDQNNVLFEVILAVRTYHQYLIEKKEDFDIQVLASKPMPLKEELIPPYYFIESDTHQRSLTAAAVISVLVLGGVGLMYMSPMNVLAIALTVAMFAGLALCLKKGRYCDFFSQKNTKPTPLHDADDEHNLICL